MSEATFNAPRKVLAFASVVEVATGLVLIIDPAIVVGLLLYPAILIGRLVSMELTSRQRWQQK